MYNGFATQDDFHAWMRAQWEIRHAQETIAQLAHGWCDHAAGGCNEYAAGKVGA